MFFKIKSFRDFKIYDQGRWGMKGEGRSKICLWKGWWNFDEIEGDKKGIHLLKHGEGELKFSFGQWLGEMK